MIRKSIILIIACVSIALEAQVGIGTQSPSSELDIDTENSGIPALKLNPQTAPVGTMTGQLSVIGDILCMFDSTRNKWLSVEVTPLQFGYALSADNVNLWFGGDVEDNNSGAMMPFDGTIVYIGVKSSGGNQTKRMDIRINGLDVGNNTDPTLDGRFNLISGSFTYTDYNIDFNSGDYISIRAAANGSPVDDPTAILWVKRRF